MTLDSPVGVAGRLTATQRDALRRMGVETVRGLIFYFPFRHEDFTASAPLDLLVPDTQVRVEATVEKVVARPMRNRRLSIIEAVLSDGSGRVTALWFNRPYLAKTIRPGSAYRFAGKVSRTKYGLRLMQPLFEPVTSGGVAPLVRGATDAPLMPVYGVTDGVSQFVLRRLVSAVEPLMTHVPDHLSENIRERYHLLPLGLAVRAMHFPENAADLAAARRRLGFDELFRVQLAVGRMRRLRQREDASPIPIAEETIRGFVRRLPFALTEDQRVAAWEIVKDTAKDRPMHRLLDGDVGSGKTVVAAIACRNSAEAGFQSAVMAPTEILARQHFETFTKLMVEEGVTVVLWTSGCKRSSRGGKTMACAGKDEEQRLADLIAGGQAKIVIGTHALIEDAVDFDRLALAVIDEQHRFGVRARRLLARKGRGGVGIPHLLSMTATPIPRSLALTVFGDLDLSLLRTKPKDRKPVRTLLALSKAERERAYAFVREELDAGRQAFVVCPLIDPSDLLGIASVTEVRERLLKKDLKGYETAILHGKMKSADQERVMAEFAAGKVQVLVATSVVEVGVDCPNAGVMCVEGAERFGLAQLHQFRGRVGRGTSQSYCYLLPSSFSPQTRERLLAVARLNDGFALAEKDLALRGPGDILGADQSGFPELRIASLGDLGLITDARRAAEGLLEADPELVRHPELRAALMRATTEAHLE